MKPQGKVTIFMVVMIVMLSVYYFFLPDNKPQNVNTTTGDQQQVVKSEEFQRLRDNLEETRQTMILTLQDVIASTEASVDEKEVAHETIQVLQERTVNEGLLETQITNLGYDDAFVQASDTNINVSILASEHSTEEANDVMLMAVAQFGPGTEVVVQFVSFDVN